MGTNMNRRKGFTIIELMVVVAILVLLIAVLIPAVSAARNTSKRVATTSQMRSLALACDSYFQIFTAYPGPLTDAAYDTNGGGGNASFSQSQALLVSLSRAFFTGDQSTATPPLADLQIGNVTNFWVATDTSIRPRDYSRPGIAGYTTYDSFVNSAPEDISSNIKVFSAAIPTFIDKAYGSDSLPILYYRAARKYDASVLDSVAGGGASMLPLAVHPSTNLAAYYQDTNEYLWFGNASAGTKTFQNSNLKNLTGTPLQSLLFDKNPVSGTFTSPKGDYVLISAGTDRIYGPDPKGNVDDIVVVGGR